MTGVPVKYILSQDNDGNLYLFPPELLERFDDLLKIMEGANVSDHTHRRIGQIFPDEIAAQLFIDEFFQYGLDNPPIELVLYEELKEGEE